VISVADVGEDLTLSKIATLSTGRQVVVFDRAVSPSNHDIFLNVVDASGSSTQFADSSPLAVESNSAMQTTAVVAASGNQALITYLDATGTTISSMNVVARLFDGATNTLGPAIPIADHSNQLVLATVSALSDNRYIIAYTDLVDIWGRIYDPSTPGG